MTKALQTLDKPYDLKTSLRWDHWENLWTSEIILNRSKDHSLKDLGLKDEDSKPTEYTLARLLPRFATANLSRLHEFYAKMITGLPKDQHDLNALAKFIETPDWIADSPDFTYRCVTNSYEKYWTLAEDLEAEAAERNALLQALEILRTNRDPHLGLPLQGRYSLDVGAVPLKLERLPKGWIIYSVGRDGKDNHMAAAPAIIDDFVVHLSLGTYDKTESERPGRSILGSGRVID